MTDVPAFHDQRARAEGFGAVALAYDRYRPGYPERLIDTLAALRPTAILDVGCGTGKAARQLATRGLPVLGVEVDAAMAAVAQSHGVEVEVSTFERWDARGRTFDLIVAGQAWHWIDPAIGGPKLIRVLRDGGTVCLFWNDEGIGGAAQRAVEDTFRRLAPELLEKDWASRDGSHEAALRRTGCFGSVRAETYRWQETISVEQWIGRLCTYSRPLLLAPGRRANLQDALREALRPGGDKLDLSFRTLVLWARP
jgi:SAM-dependent methyltransferase